MGSILAALALADGAPAQPPDGPGRTPRAAPGSFAAASEPISASSMRSELARLIGAAGGGSGAWVGTAGGETLFSASADRRRILASNTKLFTTAAAIDRLGADARLETSVWATPDDGPPPTVPSPVTGDPPVEGEPPPVEPEPPAADRVLDGDLVLVGDGDPALGSPSFANRNNLPVTPLKELAAEVRRSGIRRVKGTLRVDARIFDRRRGTGVSGWRIYVGPLSGLSYNSGLAGRDGDPALAAGDAFRRALRKRGVRVASVKRGRAPGSVRELPPVATVRSPELSRLIAETNGISNNFFAEMLLKRLAAGEGSRGTTKAGARRVERFASELGSRVHVRDGSGLSRADRASPRQVGKLLAGMLDEPGGGAFRASLPVAGREGTVRHRMRGTAAEGRCRAKTGTLTGVSALSGYCDAGGRTLVFSILMNRAEVSAARSIQDRMAAAIARGG